VEKLFGSIMPTDKDNDGSSPISGVWTQRNLGIELPKNLESVTSSDVEYLCDNSYPFLQVVNSDAVFTEETSIDLITASTGWIIHDYGAAISVSASHDMHSTKIENQKDEGSNAN
jgi:hypothetical protein